MGCTLPDRVRDGVSSDEATNLIRIFGATEFSWSKKENVNERTFERVSVLSEDALPIVVREFSRVPYK